MKQLILFCVTFFLYSTANGQQSPLDKDYYTGAIVEYATVWNNSQSPGANIRRNVDEYLVHIQKAKDKDVDIVVFPECGLTTTNLPSNVADLQLFTTIIPEARKREVPCGNEAFTDVLKRLSCAAKDNGIYVIVNLPERQMIDTNDVNGEKFTIFNSNIVFDRNGALIAKYRKYNLFGEAGFNKTQTPDITTFETDFGVTFGTFICFDILFAKPALQLLKDNPNVTDIVYPTAWFSELPFLSAVQTQAGWARANGVNLLAAGYSNPSNCSGGSGIYQADGDIKYTVPVSRQSTLIIRQIKKLKQRAATETVDRNTAKVTNANEHARFLGKMQTLKEDMTNYTTVLVNETNVDELKVCHGKFCCTFTVKFVTAENVDYRYRMIVFEGPRLFGIETNNVQICGLAACKTASKDSCGERIDSSTKPQEFDEISIKADFKNDANTVVFPSNTLYDLSVLKPSDFQYNVSNAGCHKTIAMKLVQKQDRLLAFGVYGITKSSAGISVAFVPLIMAGIISLYVWNNENN